MRFSLFSLLSAAALLAALPSLALAQEAPAAIAIPGKQISASSTVAYTNSMDVLDDTRILGVGDRVSFRVVEDRKEPVPLVVTDSGEMEVPLIGRVQAANKTCRQLAHAIRGPLEKTYFYKATVIVGLDVVGVRSKGRVYVTGQVKSQGPQEIPPDETFTLSRAILRAGGLSDFAKKKEVRLIRKLTPRSEQTTTITVNLEDILEGKSKNQADPVLKADDIIFVPEKLVNF